MKETLEKKLQDAWSLYEAGNFDDALTVTERLQKNKKFALRAFHLSGLSLLSLHRYEDALNSLDLALQLATNERAKGIITYWIARVFDELPFPESNPCYDRQKAIDLYKKASKFDFFPVDVIYKLILRLDNDFAKQKILELGIERFPDYPDLYVQLSNNLKRQGYHELQKETLEKAISKNLKSSGVYFNLGRIYFESKEFKISEEYLKNASAYNENINAVPFLCYTTGNSLYAQKKYGEAVTKFREGINANKRTSEVWYNVLGAFVCYGRIKAYKKITQMLDELPLDRYLFEYMDLNFGMMTYLDGEYMEHVGFYQDSEELLNLLGQISITTDDIHIKVNLIKSQLHKYNKRFIEKLNCIRALLPVSGRFNLLPKELEEAYEEVLSDNLFDADIVDHLVDDLQNGFISEKSIHSLISDYIEKLFQLKSYGQVVKFCHAFDFDVIHQSRRLFEYAYSLEEEGSSIKAKKVYEQYLKENPKSGAALNNLAIILRKNKEYQRALSLFKEAIKTDPEKDLYHKNLRETDKLFQEHQKKEKELKIPDHWKSSIESINVENLELVGYFEIISLIEKTNKTYSSLLERDFKEMMFNYLVGNHKSTVVMAGSFVEMALTYYCDKRRIKVLTLKDSKGNLVRKKLYECVLNDLITFVDEQKLFGSDFQHLSSLSRIYRNYIHPGLELKNNIDIKPKASLCFISSIEILKKVL